MCSSDLAAVATASSVEGGQLLLLKVAFGARAQAFGVGCGMTLAAAPASRPALGTTFGMDIDRITLGSVFGVMVFGNTGFPTGIDLTSIGMPGCELYASIDVLLSFPLTGTPTTFGLPIPGTPSLSGVVLEAQAATLTPAVNPLNLLSSNGLELKLGL